MNFCSNCRQVNEAGQNYCRHCGAPLTQPQRQTDVSSQPKPYGWASPSSPLHHVANGESQVEPQKVEPRAHPNYQPPAVAYSPMTNPQLMRQQLGGYHCPRCGTTALPITKTKISSGGWIVFVLMLIFCFPLFFIGLLMREDTRVCSVCLTQIG